MESERLEVRCQKSDDRVILRLHRDGDGQDDGQCHLMGSVIHDTAPRPDSYTLDQDMDVEETRARSWMTGPICPHR